MDPFPAVFGAVDAVRVLVEFAEVAHALLPARFPERPVHDVARTIGRISGRIPAVAGVHDHGEHAGTVRGRDALGKAVFVECARNAALGFDEDEFIVL